MSIINSFLFLAFPIGVTLGVLIITNGYKIVEVEKEISCSNALHSRLFAYFKLHKTFYSLVFIVGALSFLTGRNVFQLPILCSAIILFLSSFFLFGMLPKPGDKILDVEFQELERPLPWKNIIIAIFIYISYVILYFLVSGNEGRLYLGDFNFSLFFHAFPFILPFFYTLCVTDKKCCLIPDRFLWGMMAGWGLFIAHVYKEKIRAIFYLFDYIPFLFFSFTVVIVLLAVIEFLLKLKDKEKTLFQFFGYQDIITLFLLFTFLGSATFFIFISAVLYGYIKFLILKLPKKTYAGLFSDFPLMIFIFLLILIFFP